MKLLNFFKKILYKKSDFPIKSEPSHRIYLSVPYSEKNEAKALGAKWDPTKKLWYIFESASGEAFKRWMPQCNINSWANYFYLATTRNECFKCKKLTKICGIILPKGFKSIDDSMDDNEYSESELLRQPKNYYSILSHVTYVSPVALSEIQKCATQYDLCYSRMIDKHYFAAKCENCFAIQGDNFTICEFNAPLQPMDSEYFGEISFQKISVPIAVCAGGWGEGYPPSNLIWECGTVEVRVSTVTNRNYETKNDLQS